MSFASLLSNPTRYLTTHCMTLPPGTGAALVTGGAMTRGAGVANAAHGQSFLHTHTGNVTMTRAGGGQPRGMMRTGAHKIRSGLRLAGAAAPKIICYAPAVGGPHPGFRFLPFDPANITYMALDAGATFAMTGPLTGCTVAVLRHGGQLWFFHANVSGGGGVDAANLATKRQMVQNAAGNPAGAAYHWCEFGPANQYNGMAFVWGRPQAGGGAGGPWEFWVHDVNFAAGGGQTATNSRWALV